VRVCAFQFTHKNCIRFFTDVHCYFSFGLFLLPRWNRQDRSPIEFFKIAGSGRVPRERKSVSAEISRSGQAGGGASAAGLIVGPVSGFYRYLATVSTHEARHTGNDCSARGHGMRDSLLGLQCSDSTGSRFAPAKHNRVSIYARTKWY
jgi:hypothetical protein